MNKSSYANDHILSNAGIFKKCTTCHHYWTTRDVFLQDRKLEIIGYQVNFEVLEMGLFLFNHNCGTTLSVRAKDFVDLYYGPVYKKGATGSKECQGLCLDKDDLSYCSVQCECAHVREVVAIIKSWPKLPSPSV